MAIRQISVFIENRRGALADVTGVLAVAGIDLRAMSVADTADYGILRLIVNDTDKAAKVLLEHGYRMCPEGFSGYWIPSAGRT